MVETKIGVWFIFIPWFGIFTIAYPVLNIWVVICFPSLNCWYLQQHTSFQRIYYQWFKSKIRIKRIRFASFRMLNSKIILIAAVFSGALFRLFQRTVPSSRIFIGDRHNTDLPFGWQYLYESEVYLPFLFCFGEQVEKY